MTKLRAVKLPPSDPHSAMRRPARKMPPRYGERKRLTEQQLKNPLLRSAFERLSNAEKYRGKYLRRLDTVNGDRRTRSEKFKALERVAEPILVRLDIATSVLGYFEVDEAQFVLNVQRHIADEGDISAPSLCRLFKTMDQAGYVYRRIERIRLEEKDENGLHLVRTRVLVRFTRLFWQDLGLLYVFERVQKSAKKKREAELRVVGQRRLDDMERYSKELHRREVSRQRWQAKEARESGSHQQASLPTLRPETGPPKPSPAINHAADDALGALNRLMGSVVRKNQ